MHKIILFFFLVLILNGLTGCSSSGSGNTGMFQNFPVPTIEAEWIRKGEPIQFEEELWYPQDGTETFMDSEMLLATEYNGVQVFVDKQDVRPYHRLYTKFAPNKFRYYERKSDDDSY